MQAATDPVTIHQPGRNPVWSVAALGFVAFESSSCVRARPDSSSRREACKAAEGPAGEGTTTKLQHRGGGKRDGGWREKY